MHAKPQERQWDGIIRVSHAPLLREVFEWGFE